MNMHALLFCCCPATFMLDLKRWKWVDTGALVVSVAVVIFIITAGSFNGKIL